MKYTLQELMDMKGTSEPVRHALQAMSDEISRLRRDAERYRKLRDKGLIVASSTGKGIALPMYEPSDKQRAELDAAVDGAA